VKSEFHLAGRGWFRPGSSSIHRNGSPVPRCGAYVAGRAKIIVHAFSVSCFNSDAFEIAGTPKSTKDREPISEQLEKLTAHTLLSLMCNRMVCAASRRLGCDSWCFLGVPAISNASELKQETLNAWDDYLRTASLRMHRNLGTGDPFLWIEEEPGPEPARPAR